MTIVGVCANDNGISKVDFLRHEFLEFEEELWNNVLDYTDNVLNAKETTPFEVEVIRRFEEFGDYLHREMPYDITHGLEALESVWVWARTYSELRGIYALYEGFRRFQTQQTKAGRIPSPRLAWLDLTDAILNDPKNAVNDSVARVYDLINKERLLKEVLKVKRGNFDWLMGESRGTEVAFVDNVLRDGIKRREPSNVFISRYHSCKNGWFIAYGEYLEQIEQNICKLNEY